jgi:hypothetical protein
MIPLLNKGSKDLEELREEARSLGLVLGKDAVDGSEELNDNLHRLHAVTQGLWRQAVGALIPAMSHLVKRFLEWRKANAQLLAQKLQSFIGALVKGVEFLGDAFDFLVKNATAVKAILGVAGLIGVMQKLQAVSVATAVSTARAWLIAAAPFAAIAAAIGVLFLLFDDIRVYMGGKGRSGIGAFVKLLDQWAKPKADDVWFVKAIKQFVGALAEAIRLLREWENFVDPVGAKTREMKQIRLELFNEQGEYVGRQDITFAGGKTVQRRRGEMTIGGETVRKAGSLTGQLDATARMPSARAPVGGVGNAVNVHAPTQISVVTQPGQDNESIAGMVMGKFEAFWNGQMSATLAGAKR